MQNSGPFHSLNLMMSAASSASTVSQSQVSSNNLVIKNNEITGNTPEGTFSGLLASHTGQSNDAATASAIPFTFKQILQDSEQSKAANSSELLGNSMPLFEFINSQKNETSQSDESAVDFSFINPVKPEAELEKELEELKLSYELARNPIPVQPEAVATDNKNSQELPIIVSITNELAAKAQPEPLLNGQQISETLANVNTSSVNGNLESFVVDSSKSKLLDPAGLKAKLKPDSGLLGEAAISDEAQTKITSKGEKAGLFNDEVELADNKNLYGKKLATRSELNQGAVISHLKEPTLEVSPKDRLNIDVNKSIAASEGSSVIHTTATTSALASGGTTTMSVEEKLLASMPSSAAFSQGLNVKQNFTPNLGARIQWMISQSLSSAEILMDPPDMGPLSVKLQQVNGETNIIFQVANANVKESIDNSLEKLKELFAQQGISLGDTQVEQRQKEGTEKQSEKQENQIAEVSPDPSEITTGTSWVSAAGVDVYS